ncbi:MAG TPA: hypothetical protein DDW74_08150, partial [Porphyromonadaceae bacterium]|nr:hypothetical protein [Porphyromonadaceae bacterium]
MKTLKSVLEQDYSKKTKSELIEMLSGLEDVLSPSVYEQISGIDPSELQGLTKKEIIDIIDNFKTGYDQKWESSVARASSDALKLIFGQMAEDDKIFITSDAASADFAAELGSIDFAT